MLLLAWFCVALSPWLLQFKSFIQLATPHKVSQDLIIHPEADAISTNVSTNCPVFELKIAGAFWNIHPLNYYEVERGRVCWFTVQQYNVFGYYHVRNASSERPRRCELPKRCRNGSVPIDYYFYHGSIGYYSYYEEGKGMYCTSERTGYVRVGKLGTYDINGYTLVRDRGGHGYRHSYYYCIVELAWVLFRGLVVRRSFIVCIRFARQCDRLHARVRPTNAFVFAHESCRLTSLEANNYHRAAVLYFLVESLMTDLFFLIAKDGIFAKLQYVSLGYNLSGVVSVAFEIVETRWCCSDRLFRITKRLLFNYETALLGEVTSATMIHHYLTVLNRSELKHSVPAAKVVSFYIWGLVGHAVIVFGMLTVMFSTRIVFAVAAVWWKYQSLAVFAEPCCVDDLLGVRLKMLILGGYERKCNKLYYSVDTLKSFGLFKMDRDHHQQLLVHYSVNWFSVSRNKWAVVGVLRGMHVESTKERMHSGAVAMCDRIIGDCTALDIFDDCEQQSIIDIDPRTGSPEETAQLLLDDGREDEWSDSIECRHHPQRLTYSFGC